MHGTASLSAQYSYLAGAVKMILAVLTSGCMALALSLCGNCCADADTLYGACFELVLQLLHRC
jgi:hypothetical protein